MFYNSMIGLGFFIVPFIAFFIFLFVFWIWMLVDCLKRKFKGDNDKLLWALLLIIGGLIGAILYFFIVYNKKK